MSSSTATPQNNDSNANANKTIGKDRISTKLRRRLSVLPPTASKESIRTLTRWMLFHVQHHPHSLLHTLRNELTNNSKSERFDSNSSIDNSRGYNSHPIVCWNIIHETCTSYSQHDVMGGLNEEKWSSSSLHDFRIGLAESVIRPGLEHLLSMLKSQPKGSVRSGVAAAAAGDLQSALLVRDKLQNMAQIWQQLNCFDNVTIMDELKRIILKILQEEGSGGDDDGDVSRSSKRCKERGEMEAESGTKGGGATTEPDSDLTEKALVIDPSSASASASVSVSASSPIATSRIDLDQTAQLAPPDGGGGDTTMDSGTQGGAMDETPTVENDAINFGIGDDDNDQTSMVVDDDMDMDDTARTEDLSSTRGVGPAAEAATATATATATAAETVSLTSAPTKAAHAEDDTMAAPSSDNENGPMGEEEKEETATTTKAAKKENEKLVSKEFDFDSEGIAKGKVEVIELKEPCTSIVTMQITRDLRNDSSYNLSSLLSKVPSDVMETCKTAKNAKDGTELKDATGKIPIAKIPEDVLDLDIETALANVKLHREIIQKQKEHRMRCIELLVKSRCEFGSAEAAELFYSLEGIAEKLKKRKALILDAMELEGLDFEALGDGEGGDNDDKDFGEFSWLSKEQAESSKKQRTV